MNFDKNIILTVREFSAAAKQVIEASLPLVWIRGEISNFVGASSGHWYFSLKDSQAQVRCVMFRHKNQYLEFRPANGMQVEVLALPTLYEARGDFQLTLEKMRPAGQGALYEAFEKLKNKLEQEGLFDPERKRALPLFPRQIGIVTSLQAAALRDVLRTLSNRMPSVPVIVYPTPVQGVDAGQKIAAAIRLANERAECDTLIVCRGGGSLEDLWAFNEEVVARAIAASRIPLVCGVGHETDFTIADFVADYRAATPTAAAQASLPDAEELAQRQQHFAERLSRAMLRRLESAMQQLDYCQRRVLHPAQRLQQQSQKLAHFQQRLTQAQKHLTQHQHWRWQTFQQRLHTARPQLFIRQTQQANLALRLQEAMTHSLQAQTLKMTALDKNLQLIDPKQVLSRGYSMVRDEQGKIVVNAAQLKAGETLNVHFAQGSALTQVMEINGE
jgi:exodeoxyribonuclease VII large subunit